MQHRKMGYGIELLFYRQARREADEPSPTLTRP